jgi:hypothetical protein
MIMDTTYDLEEFLKEVDHRLETLSIQELRTLDQDTAEQERLQEEESIKQCLTICTHASKQIEQIRQNASEKVTSTQDTYQSRTITLEGLVSADRVVIDAFKEPKENLTKTASMLEESLQNLGQRQQTLTSSEEIELIKDKTELKRVQEEINIIKQFLSILAKAEQINQSRENAFDIVTSTASPRQVIVPTTEGLIFASKVTGTPRTASLLGHMSDSTLRQLIRDRSINRVATKETKETE